ncbi:MAG TPA: thioesterase family protein [Aliidiomarina sp.]|nr:thioesterase family protein [Aliidiomarina sp.]
MPTVDLVAQISNYMNTQVPFQQLLGLEITQFSGQLSEVRFRWKEELIGNMPQRILHGGVTSTALDTAGGVVVIASLVEHLADHTPAEEIMQRVAKCGTIDLRVDYLRPGRGEEFICTATIMRSGNKVAVARMEMHNEEGTHIAVGTGTYLVG